MNIIVLDDRRKTRIIYYINTFVYICAFSYFGYNYPVVDLITTSIYVHYFVYILYGIDHDPAVNLIEMVYMEGIGNIAMQMLIDVDVVAAVASVIILCMTG